LLGAEKARMARVIKSAADRKEELVDCAEALFFAKGYEATTVADILARARLSKGAFYHHFESKEDLLDALTERITAAMIAAGQDVLEDKTLDALTRLNRFLARGGRWKRGSAPRLGAIYATVCKPENAVLYQRMIKAAVSGLMPVLTRIIEQGVREKTFDVPDSEIVAEMLIHLSSARQVLVADALDLAKRGKIDRATEALEARLAVEQKIVDRMLGLPEGSVKFFEPGYIRTMMNVMADTGRGRAAKNAA
jgi:AcrR family transcriptional regulator